MECMPFWASEWHLRLMILMFLGLRLGWLRRKAASEALLDGLRARAGAEARWQESTLADNKSELQRLRDKCRNTLHLVCTILANKRYLAIGQLVFHCSRPLHKWFSETAKTLRSAEGSLLVHRELAGEEAWRPLQQITRVVADRSVPQSVGHLGLICVV